MNKNQIYINRYPDYSAKEQLIGKTIKDVAYNRSDSYDKNYLVITFTDGKFLALGENVDFDPDGEFVGSHIDNLFVGKFEIPEVAGYVDPDKKTFNLRNSAQALVDLGVISIDKDEMLKVIEKKVKEHEKYEYEYYLKLKAKYENK